MESRGSPKIAKGGSAGDGIALDHVLPVKVVPELEAITSKVNLMKSAKITTRDVSLAFRWNRDGLLSAEGVKAVELASENP